MDACQLARPGMGNKCPSTVILSLAVICVKAAICWSGWRCDKLWDRWGEGAVRQLATRATNVRKIDKKSKLNLSLLYRAVAFRQAIFQVKTKLKWDLFRIP